VNYKTPDIASHSLPPNSGNLRGPKTRLDREIDTLLYDDLGRIIGYDGKLLKAPVEVNASYAEFKINAMKFNGGANSFWDLTKMSKYGNVKDDL
jgi:hypothetical protein